MTKKIVMLGLFMLAVAGGCRKPLYLVGDSFVGGRGVKVLYSPSVTVGGPNDQKVQLFDYQLRICDYDAEGGESNCATSTILSNVVVATTGY